MKTQVELESLQEQLRVRKEKQYQLLEKLQGQEEAKRQAEDQVSTGLFLFFLSSGEMHFHVRLQRTAFC